MRRVEVIQITAALVAIPAAIPSNYDRKLIKRFKAAEAFTAEAAVELPSLSRLTRWRLSRLIALGAVVQVEPSGYFFDAVVYRSIRKKRRLIIIPTVLGIIAGVALIWLIAT